ncbi:hypothetical protein [Streptomyces syringium]|uniref:hypothetical protein n=1 Tax=Streptomyces syringium TaxID=76729 RepID=UPI003452A17A
MSRTSTSHGWLYALPCSPRQSGTVARPAAAPKTYVVEAGDSLSKIARNTP